MISVSIRNNQEEVELDFPALKNAAKVVFDGEGVKDAKITVAFFDNDTIHTMNMRHLKHDEPTDVLTFPYSVEKGKKLEGDIAIGASVAKEAAEERGHSVLAELCLLVIHGCLHLAGYTDKTGRDSKVMRRKESEYLIKAGLPDISGDE